MKKIVLLLAFLVASVYADVKYTDMFDAYDVAKDEKKLVLVMLSQKGCAGCQYMESVVFTNKDVSAYLEKAYVTVHIDIHEDSAPIGMDHFATPTFYFVDADEKILKRLNGGENAKDFLTTLKKVNEKR